MSETVLVLHLRTKLFFLKTLQIQETKSSHTVIGFVDSNKVYIKCQKILIL